MKFHVPDMSCGHCTAAITKEIQAQDPAAEIATDLETRQVSVNSAQSSADIQQAIVSAGYEATAL